MFYGYVTLDEYAILQFSELRTQGTQSSRPGSWYYCQKWKPNDSEVYNSFENETSRAWKCIQLLEAYTIFETETLRPATCE